MIRIGICDDNINMLQKLKGIVNSCFSTYQVDFEIMTYTNGQSLINSHRIERFDILFLDIDMPGTNGFDVARALRDDYINCFIIFVTSYSELVFESLNFLPFNFIRKNCSVPIEESVKSNTAKLIKYMRQNEKLLLKDDKNCDFDIYIRDIVYIANDKHYVKYHTIEHPLGLRARGLITELERKLVDYDFVKIHKSYLINLRYLSRIDRTNDEVHVRGLGKRLPMSKNYKKEVTERYTLLEDKIMTILWWIFEILVNVYQGFLMTYFVYSYLQGKENKTFINSKGPLFALLFAATITALNYVMAFEHLYALIYIIVLLLYSLVMLNGTMLQKLFSSVFAVVILLISTAFVSSTAVVLFRKDISELLLEQGLERFVVIVAVQLMILYLIFVSLKIMKRESVNKSNLTTSEWLLILIILIISIIMGALLVLLSISPGSGNSGLYTVLVFIGILIVNIVVSYLVIDLGKKNNAVRENEVLKLSQEYNRQYIDNATAEYDTIKKIQHDFKNNYSAIHALIKNGNIAEAAEQIESSLVLLQSFEIFVKSENTIVNTVVNAKLTEAKSHGIDCTCMCGTDFKTIDNLDLCRLLSNMLENAVTACVNSKMSNKRIFLSLSFDGSNYIIDLKNTIDKSVLENNPDLKTTKDNKDEHGYGVKIICSIAKKYDGLCDFYEEDGMFCCKVVLSNSI